LKSDREVKAHYRVHCFGYHWGRRAAVRQVFKR